jgi:hypothetical protein|eukprot:COSAG02_NODE_1011_length_15224_cov_12.066909_2_plen_46_part_00
MADEAYFAQHKLEERLTELINEVAAEKPADPMRYLAEKLGKDGGA